MNYYYNEEENSLLVTTNFNYKKTPKGFIKITKEEYENLKSKNNNEIEQEG